MAHLAERCDLLTCTHVARRLGLEWELVQSACWEDTTKTLHVGGYLQLQQQIGDTEPRARQLILDALVVREEYAAAAKLSARWIKQNNWFYVRCFFLVREEYAAAAKLSVATTP